MLADLSGKTAIITGGGQGLGFGISTKMAQQGANLIITDIDDRNKSAVSDLANKYNVKSFYIEMNVTDQSEVDKGINKAFEFSKVDILVNNAGVAGAPGSTGTIWRDEDWDFTWEVNVKGLHRVTEAVLPHMLEKETGKIINISSVAARAARYTNGVKAEPGWRIACVTRLNWLRSKE